MDKELYELRKTLYAYTMYTGRNDTKEETTQRLLSDLLDAAKDLSVIKYPNWAELHAINNPDHRISVTYVSMPHKVCYGCFDCDWWNEELLGD